MATRGRLAPSPTGDLHLGGAATFLVAWLEARRRSGTLVLRMEDLDTPRVVEGSREGIIDDLRWLGIGWDEGPDVGGPFGPYDQSARRASYDDAVKELEGRGLTYLCDCSRQDIARAASAPHPGEEIRYPGTCRPLGMRERDFKRPPCVRFVVPEGTTAFVDGVFGEIAESVSDITGDFVLRRGDGVPSYQLAVVTDDLAMEIDHVVRGADLLGSTARQAVLTRALGGTPRSTLHSPVVLGRDGLRLAKRERGVPVCDHREAGVAPEVVVGALAHAIGLAATDAPTDPDSLLRTYDPARLGRQPVRAPAIGTGS